MKRSSKAVALGCALAFVAVQNRVYGADVQKGKQTFEKHACFKCHAVTSNEGVKPGPSLVGVGRTRNHDWLKRFIEKPSQFKTDPTIGAEMRKFPIGMPPAKLAESEMADLLSYLDQLK